MIAFRKRPLWRGWGAVLLFGCLHAPVATADPAQGKQLFEAKNCGACHQMSGPVNEVPVAERAKIKGPPLWFAGSKFRSAWLTAWLEAPKPIRRVKFGTLTEGANEHPAVSAEDAKEVGAYLMSLTDPALKSGPLEVEKLNLRTKFNAEKLFAKKQVCFGCHQYPSRQGVIGGFSGPSLVGAGTRLQGAWIDAFLKDNRRYYPNGRMPQYGDKAFAPYTEEELALLVRYIGNL